MRGRKNTPTNIKLVTGNPGRRPLPEDEPAFPDEIPERPSWVRSKVAQREWDKVTMLLHDAGVLTAADGYIVGMLCNIVADIDRLTKQLSGENDDVIVTIKMDSLGNEVREVKTNPRVLRFENCQKELRYYSALLGLNPVDRTKIKRNPNPNKSGDRERFFN